ncbi:Kelch motif family protein [Histomonas meleagridis]|uniref:Kelch motif family protein n=1 Tax=Histomonas meleagridis TaxID=135588 RepID=UPI00355AC81D|nr:Kelch motif family protein [Histomonas meleagridis]KAH0801505.1 Kelch motif family protein [Histomonas meleagridis]
MEARGKVAIISLDGIHSTIFHAATVADRTTEQIIKDNKLKTELLGITTPYIQRPLAPNEVPSALYPKIIRTEDCGRFRLPAYYLTVMNSKQQDKITFFVNVRTTQKVTFPQFPVTIDSQQFNDKTIKDLLKFIDRSFTFSHSESSLQIGSFVPPNDYPAKDLLNQAQTKNLTLKCTLNQEYMAIVNRRSDLIKDLLQTEKSFIRTLRDFVSYWPSCLLNDHLITFNETTYIFGFYKNLIKLHTILLNDIEDRGYYFDTEFSDLFCDFAGNFQESADFCKSLVSVEAMFRIKEQNKAWHEKLEENLNSTLNPTSKTLFELLNLPIEQYQKYLTFLLQLRTVTPPAHPDSRLINEAIDLYQDHCDTLKDIKRKSEQSPQIMQLQDSLHGFVVISPNRQLVKSYNVKIIEPVPQRGIIHLFNNLIILTTTKMRKEQVLFERELSEFRYNYMGCVLSFSKTQEKLFEFKAEFQNNEEFENFLQVVEECQIKSYKNLGNYDKIMMYSNLRTEQPMPKLSFHQCAIYNKHIYYIGGKTDNDHYSNEIIDLDLNTMKYQKHETPIGDIIYHSAVVNKDKIYIFGGLSSNNQVINKFWSYTPRNNDWEELESLPEGGRYGHTMISYANDLYLFGGRNNTKIFADLMKFNTVNNTWQSINSPGSPKPRYFHTATIHGNNMVIFGGKDKTNASLSTLFLFNINDNSWKRPEVLGEKVQARYLCHSIIYHKWFFCFGGTNGTEIFEPFCVLFSNTRTTLYNLKSGGNSRQALLNFALTIYRSNIYIHGGVLTGSEKSSNMLFKVQLPHLLKQIEEIARNTIAATPGRKNNKNEDIQSVLNITTPQNSNSRRRRRHTHLRRHSHLVSHGERSKMNNEINLIAHVPSPIGMLDKDAPAPLDSLDPETIINEKKKASAVTPSKKPSDTNDKEETIEKPKVTPQRKKKPPLPPKIKNIPRRKSDTSNEAPRSPVQQTDSPLIGSSYPHKNILNDISGVPPLEMIEESNSTGENSSEIFKKPPPLKSKGIRTMNSQPIMPLLAGSNPLFPPPLDSSSDDENHIPLGKFNRPHLLSTPQMPLLNSMPPPLTSSDSDEENVNGIVTPKKSRPKPPKPPAGKAKRKAPAKKSTKAKPKRKEEKPKEKEKTDEPLYKGTLQEPVARHGKGSGNNARLSLPRGGAIPAFSPRSFSNAKVNTFASLARGAQVPTFTNIQLDETGPDKKKLNSSLSKFTLSENEEKEGDKQHVEQNIKSSPKARKNKSSKPKAQRNSLEIGMA